MGQRKKIEDILFNHDEVKREKSMQTEKVSPPNKWQIIFKKIQNSPLNKWIDK